MSDSGIYIHIPFCRSRCTYCDFATGPYNADMADRYVAAVVREVEQFSQLSNSISADTIYFGGGTPSLLTPAQVERVLTAVRSIFRLNAEPEVTMEMNPGTVDLDTLRAYRSLGVNRASFGAQTFVDRELANLGRSHSAADTHRTYDMLRAAGFENISLDLIAGLPAQELETWESNVAEALALEPEHLSLYLLEVHEGTPLYDQLQRGMWPRPDDDVAAEMFRTMLKRTAAAGFEHYEISNFCKPGYESRHNSKYWTCAPVLGFGCSAHSFDGARTRWSNERDVKKYVAAVEAGSSARTETNCLDEAALRAEAVFLGLRLMRGVDFSSYSSQFGVDLLGKYKLELLELASAGLLELNEHSMRLTSAGALLSNEVFEVFV